MGLFTTVSSLANAVQVTPETIRRSIREGELDALNKGKSYLIPHESAKDYIQRRGVPENEARLSIIMMNSGNPNLLPLNQFLNDERDTLTSGSKSDPEIIEKFIHLQALMEDQLTFLKEQIAEDKEMLRSKEERLNALIAKNEKLKNSLIRRLSSVQKQEETSAMDKIQEVNKETEDLDLLHNVFIQNTFPIDEEKKVSITHSAVNESIGVAVGAAFHTFGQMQKEKDTNRDKDTQWEPELGQLIGRCVGIVISSIQDDILKSKLLG